LGVTLAIVFFFLFAAVTIDLAPGFAGATFGMFFETLALLLSASLAAGVFRMLFREF